MLALNHHPRPGPIGSPATKRYPLPILRLCRPTPARSPATGNTTTTSNTNDNSRIDLEQPIQKDKAVSQTEGQQKPRTFPWFDNWYPIAPIESLESKRPKHFDLLGLGIVLWQDRKGNWCCMEDKCPHRLAPLSEGRIEGDTLTCSYHGWRFDCKGTCVNVPQIDDAKAHSTALANPGLRNLHGLLWVYPRAMEAAPEGSFPLDLDHLDRNRFTWCFRDMALRWDTVLENIMDPSHLPHAHHGVQGNRYNFTNQPLQPHQIKLEGFSVEMGAPPMSMIAKWIPPFTYRVFLPEISTTEFYVIPLRPGYCRFLFSLPHPPSPQGLPTSWPDLKKRVSVWILIHFPALDHLYRLELLDGDTYIIHVSERELFQKAAGQWRRAYLMLSQADAQVVTFRRWLDTYGGAVPTCRPKGADAMGPVLPKEEVLDRFHQHTSSCTYCSTAVKALNVAIPLCKTLHTLTAAAAMAGLVLIAVAYRSVHHMHSMPPGAADPKTAAATTAVQVAMLLPHELRMAALVTAISAVLAATFFLVAFCLERWRTSYFYIGYDHTTRN